MKPTIGLTDAQRAAVQRILSATLADATVLYVKTRNFHWNGTGPHFHDLHKLLETQYDALADRIDEIAERIRMLGGHAIGTMAEYLENTRLKEAPGRQMKWQEMVRSLLADHESVILHLRADLAACMEQHGDAGTQDFLTGLMQDHEKMAWMLRALDE